MAHSVVDVNKWDTPFVYFNFLEDLSMNILTKVGSN
jgi:hypothetical protein